jgi:hypothetical protein
MPGQVTEKGYLYYVVDHHMNIIAEHETFEAAKGVANAMGKVIAVRDEDGELELYAADRRVWHVLGRVHVMSSYRQALRSVIALWGSKQDREDYLDFGGGRHGVPGWAKFKALDRASRKMLMQWVYIIHKRNRDEYVAVMTGRF